jgi:hypothetical protein
VNLYPAQKRYHVGDTIWVEYQNPSSTLVDQRTSQSIAIDSLSLPFQLSFNSRYQAPVNPPGGFCDYVRIGGGYSSVNRWETSTFAWLDMGCDGARSYQVKVGIVPKHKGVYSLELPAMARNLRPCHTRKRGFPLSAIEYRFTVADGNPDVYLAIPAEQRVENGKGRTEEQIADKLVFMLQVE